MELNFEKNYYYSAIQNVYSGESQKLIENEARTALRFQGRQINFLQFCNHYSPEGWIERKIIVLPLLVWSGVVKTATHLALAILARIFRRDRGKFAQSFIYSMGRDIQETFGLFVSLFNDQYGLYHIQKSRFQKKIYEHYRRYHWSCYIDFDWTPEEVQKLFEKDEQKTASYGFACLSDKHWRYLKISRLSAACNSWIYQMQVSYEEKKRGFALIPCEELQAALINGSFELEYFSVKLLSEEHIKSLDSEEWKEKIKKARDLRSQFPSLPSLFSTTDPNPRKTLCEVLGLQDDASDKKIHKKYYEYARKYHPDKVTRNTEETEESFEERKAAAAIKMQTINEAFNAFKER